MNRLQKKCVIATAGLHLLLLAILFFGPAFFNSRSKVDNTPVLDVIPANLIDAAFNSGVKGATPPPPQPVAVPQPPAPQQQPVQPAPMPVPPAPAPVHPSLEKEIEKFFTPTPKPEPAPEVEPAPAHKIVINTQLVTGPVSPPAPKATHPNHSQDRARAINTALQSLQHNLSSPTEVNLPGNSSVAYANYGSVVLSIYHNAFFPPSGMASDNVTVKFKVKIANDGTVISSEITDSSGDPNVDAAVQRMLDRVTFIAPFPDGSTDKERTYTIDFNATH